MNTKDFEIFKYRHQDYGVVAKIDVSYDPALPFVKRWIRFLFWRITAKECVRTLMLLPETRMPSNVCRYNVKSFELLTKLQRRQIRKQNKITHSDKLREARVADYFLDQARKARKQLETLNSKLETA